MGRKIPGSLRENGGKNPHCPARNSASTEEGSSERRPPSPPLRYPWTVVGPLHERGAPGPGARGERDGLDDGGKGTHGRSQGRGNGRTPGGAGGRKCFPKKPEGRRRYRSRRKGLPSPQDLRRAKRSNAAFTQPPPPGRADQGLPLPGAPVGCHIPGPLRAAELADPLDGENASFPDGQHPPLLARSLAGHAKGL